MQQEKEQEMTRQTDNFAETLYSIRERYLNMYPGDPDEAEGWLLNNIMSYMNNYQPALSGYGQQFVKFINRGEPTKIKNVELYIRKLDALSCESAIIELWDKMLPAERASCVGR